MRTGLWKAPSFSEEMDSRARTRVQKFHASVRRKFLPPTTAFALENSRAKVHPRRRIPTLRVTRFHANRRLAGCNEATRCLKVAVSIRQPLLSAAAASVSRLSRSTPLSLSLSRQHLEFPRCVRTEKCRVSGIFRGGKNSRRNPRLAREFRRISATRGDNSAAKKCHRRIIPPRLIKIHYFRSSPTEFRFTSSIWK